MLREVLPEFPPLFHDYIYAPISTIVSGLWSVITAHNLTPEKRGPTL